MLNQTNAQTFDCGDGVPDLVIETNATVADEAIDQPTQIGAPLAFMILTIVGQLVILLAVLTGGNALVGAAAGLALLVCTIVALGARTLRQALFDQ